MGEGGKPLAGRRHTAPPRVLIIIIVSVTDHRYIGQPRGEDLAPVACAEWDMQLLKSKNGKADDKNGRNGKSVLPMERLYRPTDKEPFMNERQREYFRLKLLDWREDILKEAKETLQPLQDERQNHRGAGAQRGRHLRLLRETRRPDLDQAARGATDRDPVDRGAGAPRT